MTQYYDCGECGVGLSPYAIENQTECRSHQAWKYLRNNVVLLGSSDWGKWVRAEEKLRPAYPNQPPPYTGKWVHYFLTDEFEEIHGPAFDKIFTPKSRRYGF